MRKKIDLYIYEMYASIYIHLCYKPMIIVMVLLNNIFLQIETRAQETFDTIQTLKRTISNNSTKTLNRKQFTTLRGLIPYSLIWYKYIYQYFYIDTVALCS